MADNRDKEQWINAALGSTQGMQRAVPKAGMYEHVLHANNSRTLVRALRFPIKQWAAAAIILLALNIGSVVYYKQKKAAAGATPNPFAAALQMDTTYDY